jgi:hypothetical protein
MQDLTGKVYILPAPGKKYLWLIGSGGFTDVFKGEYRRESASGMADGRQVSRPLPRMCFD